MHTLRVHGILNSSQVNGPGDRAVVHVQGCTLGCAGCFNPETHVASGGVAHPVDELATQLADSAVDGVTVSGGEPFQQLPALNAFLTELRRLGVPSIVVFSGYSIDEINALAGGPDALGMIDLLIAGRYEAKQALDGGILASNNQRLHYLSNVFSPEQLAQQQGDVEITISPDGNVTMTGFPAPALRRAVRKMG